MHLRDYIHSDRINNFSCFSKSYLLDYLLQTEQYWIGKYVRTLRKEEFYTFYRKNKFLRYYYSGRKIFWAGNLVSLSEQVALTQG